VCQKVSAFFVQRKTEGATDGKLDYFPTFLFFERTYCVKLSVVQENILFYLNYCTDFRALCGHSLPLNKRAATSRLRPVMLMVQGREDAPLVFSGS